MNPLPAALFSLALLSLPARADDLSDRLAKILREADSDDPAARAGVEKALDAWCLDAGEGATGRLRKAAEGATPEVAGRLNEQVGFLEKLASSREFLAVFREFSMDPIKDRRWVRANTGYGDVVVREGDRTVRWVVVEGWLLEESPQRLRILQANMRVAEIRLPVKTRPGWAELPCGDAPPPGTLKEGDFDTTARKILDVEATRQRVENNAFPEFNRLAQGGLPWDAEPALFAWWALERGDIRLAAGLHAAALRACSPDLDTDAAVKYILRTLHTRLRWEAVTGAEEGLPRDRLLRMWEGVARIPSGDEPVEARRMIAGYRRELEEDAAWKEPPAGEVAALPAAKRAAYWLHHLRDAVQLPDDGKPDPAAELAAVGWEALPALVGSLHDSRPTRFVLTGIRGYELDMFFMQTYGDLCFSAIEEITGMDYAHPKPAEKLQRVEEWWKEASDAGPEAFFMPLLSENPEVGARGLLAVDARKYLPRLMEAAASGGAQAAEILKKAHPFLGPGDAEAVRKLLSDPEPQTVLAAARILFERCKDSAGAKRVAELAKGSADRPFRQSALELLAEADPEAGAAVLRAAIKKEPPDFEFSRIAAYFPEKGLVSDLVVWLDDETLTKFTGGSTLCEVRDFAAFALSAMCGYAKEWTWEMDRVERAEWIEEFKKWLKANGDSLDWKKLSARALEAFRKTNRSR
ncbi:MAG: hypothetical protein FD180_3631 [Planctomycetota bacterium]|nr:MAG: hypothetical protein FD180_3631 [Planctomycetota bacterium]